MTQGYDAGGGCGRRKAKRLGEYVHGVCVWDYILFFSGKPRPIQFRDIEETREEY